MVTLTMNGIHSLQRSHSDMKVSRKELDHYFYCNSTVFSVNCTYFRLQKVDTFLNPLPWNCNVHRKKPLVYVGTAHYSIYKSAFAASLKNNLCCQKEQKMDFWKKIHSHLNCLFGAIIDQ